MSCPHTNQVRTFGVSKQREFCIVWPRAFASAVQAPSDSAWLTTRLEYSHGLAHGSGIRLSRPRDGSQAAHASCFRCVEGYADPLPHILRVFGLQMTLEDYRAVWPAQHADVVRVGSLAQWMALAPSVRAAYSEWVTCDKDKVYFAAAARFASLRQARTRERLFIVWALQQVCAGLPRDMCRLICAEATQRPSNN